MKVGSISRIESKVNLEVRDVEAIQASGNRLGGICTSSVESMKRLDYLLKRKVSQEGGPSVDERNRGFGEGASASVRGVQDEVPISGEEGVERSINFC